MKPSALERQKRAGLPEERLIAPRRLFDPRSASVVLAFNLLKDRVAVPQVYFRGLGQQEFRSLGSLFCAAHGLELDGLAVESPVVGAGGRLYCLLSQYGATNRDDHVAITSLGAGVIDLTTGMTEVWMRGPEFFATELVGAGEDGSTVFAVVGLSKATSDGQRVAYAIGQLDFAQRRMDVIGELGSPFF